MIPQLARRALFPATVALFLLVAAAAPGAETVHLFLESEGVDIEGESTQTSLGREGSIECLSFEMETWREEFGTGGPGQRRHGPIRILKRIDKSSPLLLRALTRNEVIDGTFRFYRPNPSGDGTTEHYYTVEIRNGLITGLRTLSPNVLDPQAAQLPPTEEVSFVFHSITWTYENGGVTHADEWSY